MRSARSETETVLHDFTHASHRIEAQAHLILVTDEARPARFLRALRDALAKHGVQTSR